MSSVAQGDSPRVRVTPVLIGGAALVAAGAVFRLGGADVWWHVASGQRLLAQGWDGSEPFAFTSDQWRYTEALAQIVMAGVHALGGVDGLVVLRALLFGAATLVAARSTFARADGEPSLPGATVLAMALCASASLAVGAMKPQLFAYVAWAGAILLLVHAEARPPGARRPLVAWLPVLALVWGNLHRSGALLIALGLGTAIVWSLRAPTRRDAGWLALASLAGAAALLANTGGTFYLTSSFDVPTRETLRTFVAEWQPLTFEGLLERHAAVLVSGAAWALDRARTRRLDVEVVAVAGTLVLATQAGRLVPFLAVALLPGAARGVAWLGRRLAARQAVAVGAGLAVALLVAQHLVFFPPALRGFGVVDSRVPVHLADFLEANPPPCAERGCRMWTGLDHGGYLLYRFGPRGQVSVDGRNDTVYAERYFRDACLAPFDERIFRRLDAAYRPDLVVAPYRAGPAAYAFLHRDPAWALVYWDDVAAVLLPRRPENAAYLERHAYRALRVHDGLARVSRIATDPARDALSEDVIRNVEQAPQSMRALFFAGLLSAARGDRRRLEVVRGALAEMADERGLSPPPLPP